MFTEAEYHAITLPISNDARVLYCLGLRPTGDTTTAMSAPLNYKHLITLLNGKDDDTGPYTRGMQVNQKLTELELNGLIALPETLTLEESLSGKRILLPLCRTDNASFAHLHRQYTPIHGKWQPDPALYKEMSGLLGIIDGDFTEQDIGEFIAYWLGRPDAIFSHFQWTQKFAYAMKRNRTASGMTQVRKVGSQTVKVAAGIEADDNARKLVEKYAKNRKP